MIKGKKQKWRSRHRVKYEAARARELIEHGVETEDERVQRILDAIDWGKMHVDIHDHQSKR